MDIVTFLSDFGNTDWFVAAVKGGILKINPHVQIIDITHDIKPHDIRSAAFVLRSVYNGFPVNTIHLAVVDPGVGSERLPIIVQSRGHFFIGPDNGIFSCVYEPGNRVYSINIKTKVSQTFHARDVFGPAAAQLSLHKDPLMLGKLISKYKKFTLPKLSKTGKTIKGEIIYIDRFGNLITNITNDYEINALIIVGQTVSVKDNYSDVSKGDLVAVKGSSGYYEIACYQDNAQKILHTRLTTPITARIIS